MFKKQKHALQFLLCLLPVLPLAAQHHWHLGAMPSYNYPVTVKRTDGPYTLNAVPALGWQSKLGIGWTFGKNDLVLDWHFGVSAARFNLKLPASVYPQGASDNFGMHWSDYFFRYNTLLLQYQRTLHSDVRSRTSIGIAAGARFNSFLTASVYSSGSDSLVVVSEEMSNGYSIFSPEFAVTGNREFSIKNGMHFAYGIEAHLATRYAAQGTYTLLLGTPYESHGKLTLTGSYAGAYFSFVFRNSKERRKARTATTAAEPESAEKPAPKGKKALREFSGAWYLSFSPRLVFPVFLYPHQGAHAVSKRYSFGDAFAAGRRFRLNTRSAALLEISGGLDFSKLHIQADTIAFPSLYDDVNTNEGIGQSYWQLSAGYQYVLAEGPSARLLALAAAGLRFGSTDHSGMGGIQSDSAGNQQYSYYVTWNQEPHKLAPVFRLGVQLELPSNHGTWQIGADAMLLPFNRIEGTYVLAPGHAESASGEMAFSCGSAGIQVAYLFSFRKPGEQKK